MPSTLDVNDRQQLEASLEHWKRELAEARKAAGPVVTHEEAGPIKLARNLVARREAQLHKLGGPQGNAVAWALRQVGTTEQPAGSNRGPKVSEWEKRMTGTSGYPWCGAFVGNAIEQGGKGNITARIVYTPYIYDDAVHGRNGLERVVWRDGAGFGKEKVAHTGSLVLFDFGSGGIKHVAMLRQPWKGSGLLRTVEGNTSFGPGGSQDNGGCVARRDRDPSLVHSIVSWKS
jgi:hypothetical protein